MFKYLENSVKNLFHEVKNMDWGCLRTGAQENLWTKKGGSKGNMKKITWGMRLVLFSKYYSGGQFKEDDKGGV
jgi:hypothetical protein